MYISILDDDPIVLKQISMLLSKHSEVIQKDLNLSSEDSWHIDTYSNSKDFLYGMKKSHYDLVILDWELPESSGLELLKWLQEYFETPPATIMVTNRNAESDTVNALRAGADDFISKPFRAQELLARILSVLRRQRRQTLKSATVTPFHYGRLQVDPQQRRIYVDDQPIKLTHQEYRLAMLLLQNIDRPVARGRLYESIWGQEENPLSRTLDVHVYRVKKKLSLTVDKGWKLSSIYGYGYRLQRLEA